METFDLRWRWRTGWRKQGDQLVEVEEVVITREELTSYLLQAWDDGYEFGLGENAA